MYFWDATLRSGWFKKAVKKGSLLTDIGDVITDLGLQAGLANALGSSVEAAQKSLEKGNTKSAIGQLNALLNEIKA